MGKLMDFFSRITYKKAKKNVFENIYRNLKGDENFKLFYKDYKKIRHIKYLDKKHEAKEIYEKLINGDSVKLLQEKERMSVEVQSISFPYSSMVIALGIGIIPNIITGMINVAFPDNNSKGIVISLISVIYLLIVFIVFGQLIIGFEKEAFICTTCLKALEELEKDFENQERENEVVEEIATTVKVHEGLYKEKITKIIKGLFKKKSKFEKDKKSQEELAQEFEKLKTLNKKELVTRKGWYSREAKEWRDKANSFKILTNYITILFTVISITLPFVIQMFNITNNTVADMLDKKFKIIEQKDISSNEKAEEMMKNFKLAYDYKDDEVLGENNKDLDKKNEVNSFWNMFLDFFKTLYIWIFLSGSVGMLMVFLISRSFSKYSDKASHCETLADYINSELLKDK